MWRTYLVVWFSSEGAKPSEVTQRLLNMGFKPTKGQYDYVYEWSDKTDIEDILKIGDKVQNTLKGMGVLYKLETFAPMDYE
ncbi:MAG: hypothetical protein J7K08_06190 [Thermoplasmata archaeon]|nr:hypothetical protein [Thermoplasmata archaeon]OYT49612.1 MAG: hypothetical protein B6U83_01825 [Thermoplasmatales archaeon ex4484_36]HDD60426.1 hypothetical protein [Euryarchaeota archaeon]RLF55107.1 MAG: hypothetical protein DRN28_04040 [Thermoplasmata archaeon]RLF70934.1 MAG: hypothetical protein DRN35_03375 [Thermoplasmata archaeon]